MIYFGLYDNGMVSVVRVGLRWVYPSLPGLTNTSRKTSFLSFRNSMVKCILEWWAFK